MFVISVVDFMERRGGGHIKLIAPVKSIMLYTTRMQKKNDVPPPIFKFSIEKASENQITL